MPSYPACEECLSSVKDEPGVVPATFWCYFCGTKVSLSPQEERGKKESSKSPKIGDVKSLWLSGSALPDWEPPWWSTRLAREYERYARIPGVRAQFRIRWAGTRPGFGRFVEVVPIDKAEAERLDKLVPSEPTPIHDRLAPEEEHKTPWGKRWESMDFDHEAYVARHGFGGHNE